MGFKRSIPRILLSKLSLFWKSPRVSGSDELECPDRHFFSNPQENPFNNLPFFVSLPRLTTTEPTEGLNDPAHKLMYGCPRDRANDLPLHELDWAVLDRTLTLSIRSVPERTLTAGQSSSTGREVLTMTVVGRAVIESDGMVVSLIMPSVAPMLARVVLSRARVVTEPPQAQLMTRMPAP